MFCQSSDEQCRIMEAVPFGVCSINDVLKIGGNLNLLFSGIGLAGMDGVSAGKFGYDFFSHEAWDNGRRQSEQVEMGSISLAGSSSF